MKESEQLEKIKKNILAVDWSMDDTPYMGFSSDNIRGVRFAIEKILEGTGITIESLFLEREEKHWFES
ncbi:hypothetical protein [Oceanobacillus oncorhynchi]|uniref:hypothetical protein n=1 Tax=Oceanobacillus oncorhynchi TaxID=545501 RepID=UPI0034D70D26